MEVENGNQDFDYDLVTIGAGSGGVRAARMASGTYGAKVSRGLLMFFASKNKIILHQQLL